MPCADRNKENEVGNHYVGYMKSQKNIVKKLLNVAVVRSADSTSEAEPSDRNRSAKPKRSKVFTDILESDEEDIPSPAYSPHRPKRKISAVSEIKKEIAEKIKAKKSQAQKRTKEKKNKETLINKDRSGPKKVEPKVQKKTSKKKNEGTLINKEKSGRKVEPKFQQRTKEKIIEGTLIYKEKNGQNKIEKTEQLTLREFFSQWKC